MTRWIQQVWIVFRKDVRQEYRNRLALNVLFLFTLSSLLLIAFSVRQLVLPERMQAALLWITLVFAAASGLGRAFLQEAERGTLTQLQLLVGADVVWTAKAMVNLVLLLLVEAIAVVAMHVWLGVVVLDVTQLMATLLLGALGLSSAITMLSALIAVAQQRSALLPILLFPLLVPLLFAVVDGTVSSLFDGDPGGVGARAVWTLVAYGGTMTTAAYLLIDHLWVD